MYCTTNLWLPSEQAGKTDLSKPIEGIEMSYHSFPSGEIFYTGKIGLSAKVVQSKSGIKFSGSLAKYLYGNNLQVLTRKDTATAIEKLSDELSLPMLMAKVSRTDIGDNLLMDFKTEAYYPYLGQRQHFKRLEQPKSLSYQSANSTISIYNKIAEMKATRQPIPSEFMQSNVLRYEMRFLRQVSKQLKRPEITAATLYDKSFFLAMVDQWEAEFLRIDKLHEVNINPYTMKSPKDYFKQHLALHFSNIGQEIMLKEVERLKQQNAFSKPEYYSRLKREIKELCKAPEFTKPSELMQELEKKVKDTANLHRSCL